MIEMSVNGGIRWLPCPEAGVERAFGKKVLTEVMGGALFRSEYGHLVRLRPEKIAKKPERVLPGDDGFAYPDP